MVDSSATSGFQMDNPRASKHRAFMQILWGLIFIAVDIKINDLDVLLPDVIGYVLVYTALQRLAFENVHFRQAQAFAVVGGIASVPAMLPIPSIQPLAAILQTSFDLVLIWYVCSGIIYLADARSNVGLANAATTRRTLYLIASIINLAIAALALAAPELLKPYAILAIPLVAFSLAVLLLIMLLLKKASVEAT